MFGLTVFTPTFNRAHTLERLYKSLVNQTNKNFEWLIVDDGSTDNTKNVISNFINEKKIAINYIYQENSGKHIAHNKGVENSKGKLFTCLDSDDWFYNDTVKIIIESCRRLDPETYCGLIGLDTYESGDIIGDNFPLDLTESTWIDLSLKHKIRGDKAIVFFTKVLKKFDFPVNNDKHMPPSYQLFKMSGIYKFKLINKPLKYVEYLEDGITYNIREQYKRAPNNYVLYRCEILNHSNSLKFRIKNLILLNIARIYAKTSVRSINLNFINKILLIILYPLGLTYVLYKERK